MLTAAIGIAILQAAFSNFKHNGTQVYAFGGGRSASASRRPFSDMMSKCEESRVQGFDSDLLRIIHCDATHRFIWAHAISKTFADGEKILKTVFFRFPGLWLHNFRGHDYTSSRKNCSSNTSECWGNFGLLFRWVQDWASFHSNKPKRKMAQEEWNAIAALPTRSYRRLLWN